MFLRLIAAVALGVLIGAWLILQSLPVHALGYPIPQPKPCVQYWDSKFWHEYIAKDPRTLAYLASPHEVIAKSKQGDGVQFTHDKKGCLVIRKLHSSQVDKLLSKQGDA